MTEKRLHPFAVLRFLRKTLILCLLPLIQVLFARNWDALWNALRQDAVLLVLLFALSWGLLHACGWAAERLLRDKAVRTGGTRVNLVVYKVDKFYHVHLTDGNPVFEGFARSAVVKLNLAVHFAVRVDYIVFFEKFSYVAFGRAVEYRGCDLPAELLTNKT